MPIEFRCSHCGKLLRTPDETAGRQAQCPECGALTEVPAAAAGSAAPPLAPLGSDSAAGEAEAAGTPFRPGTVPPGFDSANPYQSPYGDAYAVAPAQRVSGPAVGLIVTAISGIILQGFGLLGNLMTAAAVNAGRPPMQGRNDFQMFFTPPVLIGTGAFALVMGVLVLIGAMKMKRLESYSLAMTSAIVALIPCISPCCILGLPFGIWALVVLNDPFVKASFRS